MSKIGKGEWIFLYIFTAFLDVIQWLLDLTGIGIGINAAADPFIGLILAGYFQIRGVSLIKHPTRLLSLVGVTLIEEISGGIAPAWVIDVWYIHQTVKREDAESKAQSETDNMFQPNIRKPLYKNGVRQPDSERVESTGQTLNDKGIRPPNGGLR